MESAHGDVFWPAQRQVALAIRRQLFVLKAGPKFDLLAINSIGGERMNGSLAVSDGDIFMRTDKQLWCIGSLRR